MKQQQISKSLYNWTIATLTIGFVMMIILIGLTAYFIVELSVWNGCEAHLDSVETVQIYSGG